LTPWHTYNGDLSVAARRGFELEQFLPLRTSAIKSIFSSPAPPSNQHRTPNRAPPLRDAYLTIDQRPRQMKAEYVEKQREYEAKKARAKALKLRLTCTICGANPRTLLNCPCGTTQYCSTECQRIDWRDRGHRKACKKIRNERAAEAARAEAPIPPPSPPVYGPAPRSQADEIRARIAAEHEAARARREANPERQPLSARWGSRCPICLEEWDVNEENMLRCCCCRVVCTSCEDKIGFDVPCPLCRAPATKNAKEELAQLRRHVENEVPEAIKTLGDAYCAGRYGLVRSAKKVVSRVRGNPRRSLTLSLFVGREAL